MMFLTRVPMRIWITLATLTLATLIAGAALAHNVTEGDAGYVQEASCRSRSSIWAPSTWSPGTTTSCFCSA